MVIAIFIVAAVLGVVGVLVFLGRREHAVANREFRAIVAIPVSEARLKAETLLQTGMFKVIPATVAPTNARLPREVRTLFGQYREISSHEFWLGHAALSESARLPGHIKIGGDSEFEEILVAPDEDTLWLSYPLGELGKNPGSLPSVWYKILVAASDVAVGTPNKSLWQTLGR